MVLVQLEKVFDSINFENLSGEELSAILALLHLQITKINCVEISRKNFSPKDN